MVQLNRIVTIVVLSLGLGLGCSCKKVSIARDSGERVFDRETSMARARLREGHWETTRSIRLVDAAVLKALKTHFGPDDRLARAEEPFDWTGESGQARRRFDFAARSGQTWVLVYERGARNGIVVVMLEVNPTPHVVMVASGEVVTKRTGGALRWTVDDLAREVGTLFPLYPVDSAIY